MTTDSVSKQVVVEGAGWSIGGMAKGAGMLAPQLATMLVVLTTDAVVDAADLDTALRAATRVTASVAPSSSAASDRNTAVHDGSIPTIGRSAAANSPTVLPRIFRAASSWPVEIQVRAQQRCRSVNCGAYPAASSTRTVAMPTSGLK